MLHDTAIADKINLNWQFLLQPDVAQTFSKSAKLFREMANTKARKTAVEIYVCHEQIIFRNNRVF